MGFWSNLWNKIGDVWRNPPATVYPPNHIPDPPVDPPVDPPLDPPVEPDAISQVITEMTDAVAGLSDITILAIILVAGIVIIWLLRR